MFERFTAYARRAVVTAQEEARELNHNYIGTEHILLALLRRPDGLPMQEDGIAPAILEEFGLKTNLSATTSAEWFKLRPDSAVRPAYSVLDTEPFARFVGRPMRPWREALHVYRVQVDRDGF